MRIETNAEAPQEFIVRLLKDQINIDRKRPLLPVYNCEVVTLILQDVGVQIASDFVCVSYNLNWTTHAVSKYLKICLKASACMQE